MNARQTARHYAALTGARTQIDRASKAANDLLHNPTLRNDPAYTDLLEAARKLISAAARADETIADAGYTLLDGADEADQAARAEQAEAGLPRA